MKSKINFKPSHTQLVTEEDFDILLSQSLEYALSEDPNDRVVKNVHTALKLKLDKEKYKAQVAIALGRKPARLWFFEESNLIGDAKDIKVNKTK